MTKQQRIFTWLNMFLLIINISALSAFLLMNYSGKPQHDERFSSDEFLREELNLTPDQFRKVSSMNASVYRAYQVSLDRKCELKFQLIDEMLSDSSSRQVMDSLAEKIGKVDGFMKKQTVRHFENIKSVCNAKQDEMLDVLLREMLDADNQCKYCNKIDCSRRVRLNQ